MSEEDTRLTRDEKEELLKLLPEGQVTLSAEFWSKTSIFAGGIADVMAVVNGIDELKKVLSFVSSRGREFVLLGCGSKTLVRDGGFGGVVIALGEGFSEISFEESGECLNVTVGSKTLMRDLVAACSEKGTSDANWLLRFGGTVGGCAARDVSIGKNSMSELVQEATVIMKDGREMTIRGRGLKGEDGRLKIPSTVALTKMVIQLKKDAAVESAVNSTDWSAKTGDSECVGLIRNVFADCGKVTAAELIEECGLPGVRVGGARISRGEANCILNEGGAKARDVLVLVEMVRDRIKQAQGFQLELAVSVVGQRKRQ